MQRDANVVSTVPLLTWPLHVCCVVGLLFLTYTICVEPVLLDKKSHALGELFTVPGEGLSHGFRNSKTRGALVLRYVDIILRRSAAKYCKAQHSAAQRSTAQHSAAKHCTALHSTAQHCTALHSIAQHSSVPCHALSAASCYTLPRHTFGVCWAAKLMAAGFSPYQRVLSAEEKKTRDSASLSDGRSRLRPDGLSALPSHLPSASAAVSWQGPNAPSVEAYMSLLSLIQ